MSEFKIGSLMNVDAEPRLLWIELASTLQLPSFHIVGLPSPEVAEARERVRAAVTSSGFEFPRRRVVLNLSPASVRKQGTGVDLAMALAVLSANSRSPSAAPDRWVAWGELGLDGTIKPSGQLTRLLHACCQEGVERVLLAESEIAEARAKLALLRESGERPGRAPELLAAGNLREAWEAIQPPTSRRLRLPTAAPTVPASAPAAPEESSPDPRLLPLAPSLRRILGVAASGQHHLLLLGSKGTGKSHAIEWLIALQPPAPTSVRVTQLLLQELMQPHALPGQVPVRRIGAQARPATLAGSVASGFVRPGEFSLAHGGLLVADEFPEWPRDARECLREPMERGRISLSRARARIELPARFLLAATGNYCPCGGWPPEIAAPEAADAPPPACRCPLPTRQRYLDRLSGPVLDRVDLVARLLARAPSGDPSAPTLAALREQVRSARERAVRNWGAPAGALGGSELEQLLAARPGWAELPGLRRSASLRSRHKILRLALSLASWDGLDEPLAEHFAEAQHFRPERWHGT